jgi:hypothetical protein
MSNSKQAKSSPKALERGNSPQSLKLSISDPSLDLFRELMEQSKEEKQ